MEPGEARKRCSVDVERVRLPVEEEACARLQASLGLKTLPYTPQDAPTRRRELLRSALLLTETMAPMAHAAARATREALGLLDEIEVFESNGWDTARLALHGHPIGVEFMGGYMNALDIGGLTAVIGHEVGHALAHKADPRYAWALAQTEQGHGPTNPEDRRNYALAAELTADRFGLLACRDLDAALRLEMLGAVGRAAPSLHLDASAYLDQCKAVAEDILCRPDGRVAGTTHPEHYVRGYAVWLFFQTDAYAEISGNGPAVISLDEANAQLARLLSTGSAEKRVSHGRFVIEPLPARPSPNPNLEGVAADILTDGARRRIAHAGRAISNAAKAVVPTLRKVAGVARAHGDASGGEEGERPVPTEPAGDLRARFEAFTKRQARKPRGD